jgi:hypothetical protein
MANKQCNDLNALHFAVEKYSTAIEVLATGEDDVRHRLLRVYESIASVPPNHVPNDRQLRNDIEWILNQMNRHFGGTHWDPSWGEMMQRFKKRNGVKIAERIHKVWCNLCGRQAKLQKKNLILRHFGKPGCN